MRALVFVLATALAPSLLHADALSDLKVALRRLPAQQALSATVDLQRSRHSKGRFLNDDFEGSASVSVDLDANTMRMRYSRQLLEHAEDEQWARSLEPTRSAGTAEALSEALPVALENTFDGAKPLLRLLSRGTVEAQRNEGGARVVVLRLTTTGKPESGDRMAVTISDDQLTLWLDGEGVPQRATRVRKGTAGILFVHIDTVRTESWTYARHADHLVAMRTDDRASVSGAGQKGDARTLWAVRAVEAQGDPAAVAR